MVEIKLTQKEVTPSGEVTLKFGAVNRGETLGECTFTGKDTTLSLTHVTQELKQDAYLLDGIIRAAMNYGLSDGYATAVVKGLCDAELDKVLEKLGYYAQNMEIDINSFFHLGCHGGGCSQDCANCNQQKA